MTLNANLDIADTLRQAQEGKLAVEVFLGSGQSFKGHVHGVGEHTVVIGPLQGKDFFDAQICMGAIVAVMLQTRTK